MSNIEQSKAKTKKETESLTFKDVVDQLKKSHFGFSLELLYFSLSIILSLLLAYVFPYSLIATVPFLIIPCYFAYSSSNTIKSKNPQEKPSFFKLFKAYFNPFFFGGYRLLIGLLKALIVYLACNTLLLTVFETTLFSKYSEFNALLDKIASGSESVSISETVNEFNETLLANPNLQKWIYFCSAISVVLAGIVFVYHIAKHSIKMRRNFYLKQSMPMKQFNIVEGRVRKENRRFILGSYLRTTWFIQVLFFLMAGGGITLSFFFLKDFTSSQAFVISFFLIFLVSLPFFNYFCTMQDILYEKLTRKYEHLFATLTLEFLTKYKEKIGIAEEDAKKIEEILNAQKEANKEETDQVIVEEEENKDLDDKK